MNLQLLFVKTFYCVAITIKRSLCLIGAVSVTGESLLLRAEATVMTSHGKYTNKQTIKHNGCCEAASNIDCFIFFARFIASRLSEETGLQFVIDSVLECKEFDLSLWLYKTL